MKYLLVIMTSAFILFQNSVFSFQVEDYVHASISVDASAIAASTGGKYKPSQTGTGEYFRALIVFVEFQNDPSTVSDWSYGSLPGWADDFIDSDVSSTYTDMTLSDYWDEMSLGTFDFIGDVYPSIVTLDSEDTYRLAGKNFSDANHDVIAEIDPNVDFSDYDNWRLNTGTGSFEFVSDGNVDMIIFIYRNALNDDDWFTTKAYNLIGFSGVCYALMPGESYSTGEGPVVYGGVSQFGSGITFRQGWRGHNAMLEYISHEYGHYLFGTVHWNTGGIMGGNTYALSGWEREKLGYISYSTVNTDGYTSVLGDFIADGDIVKVPITTSSYFLIENHQKESHYDQIIRGGSVEGWYDFNTTVGSGIYIWRVYESSGKPYSELRNADGFWNWSYVGDYNTGESGWYEGQTYEGYLPKFERSSINRDGGKSDRYYDNIARVGVCYWPTSGIFSTCLV